MRLVVDTSVLVGELLYARGRARLADERLESFLPEGMWAELRVEIPRRIAAFSRHRRLESRLADDLGRRCIEAVEANLVAVEEAVYSALQTEARARCPRDANSWPVVAAALVLSAGVWTNDKAFLGTGVPTWTTETIEVWLERHDG